LLFRRNEVKSMQYDMKFLRNGGLLMNIGLFIQLEYCIPYFFYCQWALQRTIMCLCRFILLQELLPYPHKQLLFVSIHPGMFQNIWINSRLDEETDALQEFQCIFPERLSYFMMYAGQSGYQF